MHLYRHHIGDYAAATGHLSFVEDAAYCRLLRIYYATEKPLPADVCAVQRLASARSREEKKSVELVLKEFFSLDDDGWRNKRADEEIAAYKARSLKNKEIGKKGGRPKKTETVSEENPNGFDSETETVSENNPTNNHKPITNINTKTLPAVADAKPVSIQKKSGLPVLMAVPGMTEQVAKDHLAVRKAKKSPLTETALALIAKEADKAGISTAQAIAISTARGWVSFKAEWISDKSDKTYYERTREAKERDADRRLTALANATPDELKQLGLA